MPGKEPTLTIAGAAQDIGALSANLRTFVTNLNRMQRYSWAFPSLGSTAEAVDTFLASSKSAVQPEPCLYHAHLGLASALLDGCLARNDQIVSLEAVALTTALELLYAEVGHPLELALAQVGLKAVRKQAGAGDGDAGMDTLDRQFEARSDARNARIVLHLQPGSALNFKERIDDLRLLLADDIRSIRELLQAARIGMHQAGVAPNLPEVPAWDKGRSDNLKNLVNWCRSAIRTMEISSKREVISQKAILLVQDGLVSRADFTKFLNSESKDFKGWTDQLQFEVQPNHFLRGGPHRILNVGLALKGGVSIAVPAIFPPPPQDPVKNASDSDHAEKTAQGLALCAVVRTPRQSATFASPAGSPAIEWSREALDLNGEVGVWNGIQKTAYPAHAGAQLYNANPVGKWGIFLQTRYVRPDGDGQLKDLASKGIAYGGASWDLRDIVLFMTIASLQA